MDFVSSQIVNITKRVNINFNNERKKLRFTWLEIFFQKKKPFI